MKPQSFHFRRRIIVTLVVGAVSLLVWAGYAFRTLPTVVSVWCSGPKDLPYVRQQLKSRHLQVRSAAAQTLGSMKRKAASTVPELLEGLQDGSPTVAANCAWALGSIESQSPEPRVIAALIGTLDHPDGEVRRSGAYSLGQCGPSAFIAVSALMRKLDDEHMGWTAAASLGQMGPAGRVAIPRLSELLDDSSNAMRGNAAFALCQLQPLPDETVAAIKKLVTDDDPLVRNCVIRALNEHPLPGVTPPSPPSRGWRLRIGY